MEKELHTAHIIYLMYACKFTCIILLNIFFLPDMGEVVLNYQQKLDHIIQKY